MCQLFSHYRLANKIDTCDFLICIWYLTWIFREVLNFVKFNIKVYYVMFKKKKFKTLKTFASSFLQICPLILYPHSVLKVAFGWIFLIIISCHWNVGCLLAFFTNSKIDVWSHLLGLMIIIIFDGVMIRHVVPIFW